jgi:hypothetical protein
MRIARTLMLLVVSGAIASCYKPTIGDKLKCNLEAGTNHFCPDGFACEFSTGLCKRSPSNDVADRPDGGGEGGSDVDAGPDVICFDPRPNCQPDNAGLCDPFCQTGCGCREKCSVNTGGNLTCNALAPGLPRGVLQNCEPLNTGSSTQNDACNPGLVCLAGADDACTGRCYQFCRTEADCNNAPCDKIIAGGRKVCDVPFVDCNPVPPISGCPGAQSCFLSTTNPTRTICDCAGTVPRNDPCNRSRDCLPGLVCVDPTNTGDSRCRQVCLLSDNGSNCAGGLSSCMPFKGNSTTANPTFGFCN